jgi:hypothetical protein
MTTWRVSRGDTIEVIIEQTDGLVFSQAKILTIPVEMLIEGAKKATKKERKITPNQFDARTAAKLLYALTHDGKYVSGRPCDLISLCNKVTDQIETALVCGFSFTSPAKNALCEMLEVLEAESPIPLEIKNKLTSAIAKLANDLYL